MDDNELEEDYEQVGQTLIICDIKCACRLILNLKLNKLGVETWFQQTQEEEKEEDEEVVPVKTPEFELYSDEEIEENLEPIRETLVFSAFKRSSEPEPKELPSDEELGEEEEDDDVEIIGDEQIEEEEVEELDDEDISDVDDAELLSRLEAKYGSLADTEKAPTKHSKCEWHAVCLRLIIA